MTNKHMKRYSVSLVIKDMQTKTKSTRKYALIRLSERQESDNTSPRASKDAEPGALRRAGYFFVLKPFCHKGKDVSA